MRYRVGAGSVIKSGMDPCGVCNKGVGSNKYGKIFAAKRVQMVLFNWKDWRRYHLVLKVERI